MLKKKVLALSGTQGEYFSPFLSTNSWQRKTLKQAPVSYQDHSIFSRSFPMTIFFKLLFSKRWPEKSEILIKAFAGSTFSEQQ